MPQIPKWYIIHTYSGYENKVAQDIMKVVENRNLYDLICEVSVPIETVTENIDGKERTFDRKIYPGYVLVKMICNDDTWYIVKNIRGVTGFVGPGSKPTPLTEKEVERIGVEKEHTVETNIAPGDKVQIVGTAMDGFVGTVNSVDATNKTLNITLSMFGKPTPTDVSLSDVVKLDY